MPDKVIAVVTGSRCRAPTLYEYDQLSEVINRRGITHVREGDCPPSVHDSEGRLQPSTDRDVGAWLKARTSVKVEACPADWKRYGKSAGPRRNREMLDGGGAADLFGVRAKDPATVLIHFRGGRGTADCTGAALDRALRGRTMGLEFIVDADEPRPWNAHHGAAPGPCVYVGASRKHGAPSPLANPFRADRRDGETREQAGPRILGMYKRWLWGQLKDSRTGAIDMIRSFTPGHYLACSCWPRHCHAEVIIRAWRWTMAQPRATSACPTTI